MQRWHDDRFAYPPYWYEERYLISDPNLGLRSLCSRVRVRLLGFPVKYITGALDSNTKDAVLDENANFSLVDNSFLYPSCCEARLVYGRRAESDSKHTACDQCYFPPEARRLGNIRFAWKPKL